MQVAEALDPTARFKPPYYFHVDGQRYDSPPRYDADWSATGPLIERLQITLWNDCGQWQAGNLDSADYEGHWLNDANDGDTPLIAVCHLILALHAAGKLEKVA